jgi:hypothetical protein
VLPDIRKPSPWDPLLRLRWKIWDQWHHLKESERVTLGLFLGALLLLFAIWICVQLRHRRKSPAGDA